MYYFKFNVGDIIEYVPQIGRSVSSVGVIIGFNRSYPDIAEVEWLSGLYGRGTVNINDCKRLTG
jgi:hypothetical protein